jgi:hypothetical protein
MNTPQWVAETIGWLQSHSQLASYGTAASAIAAVCTFLWKVAVDSKEAALKRFDKFQEMRKRTDEGTLSSTLDTIDGDCEPSIADLDLTRKEEVLAFYEEIAIMANSGLIGRRLAYYMFGYYAKKINESRAFWADGTVPSTHFSS